MIIKNAISHFLILALSHSFFRSAVDIKEMAVSTVRRANGFSSELNSRDSKHSALINIFSGTLCLRSRSNAVPSSPSICKIGDSKFFQNSNIIKPTQPKTIASRNPGGKCKRLSIKHSTSHTPKQTVPHTNPPKTSRFAIIIRRPLAMVSRIELFCWSFTWFITLFL
ncbi:hypothetical protein ES703_107212 [subsurface metagenome]